MKNLRVPTITAFIKSVDCEKIPTVVICFLEFVVNYALLSFWQAFSSEFSLHPFNSGYASTRSML